MERHTYAVNFNASPCKVRKNGALPINATITLNGQKAIFSTGKKVNIEDWDAIKQKVKGSNEQAKHINNYLSQIKNTIYKQELELLERGCVIR